MRSDRYVVFVFAFVFSPLPLPKTPQMSACSRN
jgi:hypothetical protein